MRAFPILLILLATPASLVAQTVYKCTEASGTIVYSQQPCSADPAKVEAIDTTPSQMTGSGGFIAEQGEFAQMNEVRRNCDARMQSIRDRYAGQTRRLSDEIDSLNKRSASNDYRLIGSTYQLELKSQIARLTDERSQLKAAEAKELSAEQERCQTAVKEEEERQLAAQTARAEAKRIAEKAAADKAAEDQRRADAAAKLKANAADGQK